MQQPVFLVSGLPRSGTSMMMKMLEAGGIEIVTDHLRQADDDNPKGYYELEAVKHLQNDARWMHYMRGKALKVVSSLLFYVPLSLPYKIIFMRRILGKFWRRRKKCLTVAAKSPIQLQMMFSGRNMQPSGKDPGVD
jgi:hypothetical protein